MLGCQGCSFIQQLYMLRMWIACMCIVVLGNCLYMVNHEGLARGIMDQKK